MKDESIPFWKLLNEKRTSGIYIVDDNLIVATDKPETYPEYYNDGIVIREMATKDNTTDENIVAHFEQSRLNAQYTALAVNNLASLAEALEKIVNEASNPDKEDAEGLAQSMDFILNAAKSALKAIS